jgi:hypothetical protein
LTEMLSSNDGSMKRQKYFFLFFYPTPLPSTFQKYKLDYLYKVFLGFLNIL